MFDLFAVMIKGSERKKCASVSLVITASKKMKNKR